MKTKAQSMAQKHDLPDSHHNCRQLVIRVNELCMPTCQRMPSWRMCCSKTSTTMISPLRAAMYKGASPAEFLSTTSAPPRNSSFAQPAWPDSQATNRGVAPPLSLALTPLPRPSSACFEHLPQSKYLRVTGHLWRVHHDQITVTGGKCMHTLTRTQM